MKKRDRFKPYIRRMRPTDKASDLRTAMRLAFFSQLGKGAYVLVQRGFPNIAIGVGKTRRDVAQSPWLVAAKVKTFKQWARDVKRNAQGRRRKEGVA